MKHLLTSIILAATPMISGAQALTGYFLNNQENASAFNPAFNANCKAYVSLYGLYLDAGHSAFGLKDALKDDDQSDSYILDLNNIYGKLGKKNVFYTDQQINLLNFGFRAGEGFINAGFGIKSSEQISYSKNLLKIKDGTYFNDENSELDLSGTEINAKLYYEISLGYSRNISDKLTVGVALKRLQGLADITSRKSDIKFTTKGDMYDLALETDLEFDVASNVEYDVCRNEDNQIDSLHATNIDFDNFEAKDIKTLLKPQNGGWALDFGATYKILPRLTLAASVIDLGAIKWKSGNKKFTQSGTFNFTGIDISDYFSNLDSIGDVLSDSLNNYVTPVDSDKSYLGFLNTKIYLSGEYEVNNWFTGGLMWRGVICGKKLVSSLTSSANLKLGHSTQFAFSWTIMNSKANLFGIGYVQKLGGVQFHFIMDQISPAFWACNDSSAADKWIKNTTSCSFQTGMSIIIGRKYLYNYSLLD